MDLSVLSFLLLTTAGPALEVRADMENAFLSLQEAIDAKKEADVVKDRAVQTCALARQVTGQSVPEGDLEKEVWNTVVERARQIELYTEYALYAAAVQSPPAATVDLLFTLEQQNPRSKYLDDAYGRYFLALNQTGAAKTIPAVAEKAIAHFPSNEDLLLVLADTAMSRQQNDRALHYAERLLVALGKRPRPEGMPAAEWERKRTAATARGRWIAGLMHGEKGQHYEADKDLRAALPLIKGDAAMLAPALFYLGLANYELGRVAMNKARVLEAAAFSEQAAGLGGPLARQAWVNAMVMKTEAGKMR
jgi:tetratricopeptide (TPR) repeat protein